MPPKDIATEYQTGEREWDDLDAITDYENDLANLYHE